MSDGRYDMYKENKRLKQLAEEEIMLGYTCQKMTVGKLKEYLSQFKDEDDILIQLQADEIMGRCELSPYFEITLEDVIVCKSKSGYESYYTNTSSVPATDNVKRLVLRGGD